MLKKKNKFGYTTGIFYNILFLSFFLIINLYFAYSDNTFESSYSKFEYFEGGSLHLLTSDKIQEPTSVLIKPNWAESTEVLYVWSGIARTNAKGSTFGGAYILAAKPLDKIILLLWKLNERFFISANDTNFNFLAITELQGDWDKYSNIKANWVGKTAANDYLLLIDNNLVMCRYDNHTSIQASVIYSNVVNAAPMLDQSGKQTGFIYVLGKEGNGAVFFVDNDGYEHYGALIPVYDEIYIFPKNDEQATIVSSSKSSANSLITIIQRDRGIVYKEWIEAYSERLKLVSDENDLNLYYLKNVGNEYTLIKSKINIYSHHNIIAANTLQDQFIEPYGLWIIDDVIYCLFRNGLATFDKDGKQLSSDFIPFGEMFIDIPELTVFDNYLVLSSKTASLVLEREDHPFWLVNRFFMKESGKVILPAALIVALIVLFQFYRSQKHTLKAILNLSSVGIVYILDKQGRLTGINSSGRKLLGLSNVMSVKKVFQYYCVKDSLKPLRDLIDKSLNSMDEIKQKINLTVDGEPKEYYCTTIPYFSAFGKYKGMIFTGVDITEELERKRLSNWAQLAHDMQTNLTTIKLNAEQLDVESSSENLDRRKKIIHQVGLLIHRIRDIVTVGRSDSIDRQIYDAFDICHQAIQEFDETLYPNVTFSVETEHFNVSIDKPKMLRAFRNAIENGIRSMSGKEGNIKVTSYRDSRNAYFSIKDTGVGMDEKTRKKVLTPYFTTSKKQGGHGIGTMIMQHVLELHGGTLKINSEKGKGTELIFSIPNSAINKPIKN